MSAISQIPAATATYKDRSTGLTVYGVLTILMGCFAVLSMLMMFLVLPLAAKQSKTPIDTQFIAPAVAINGLAALVLIWLGIGSIMARRWARALLLILSTVGLVTGVMVFCSMVLMYPQMMEAMRKSMEEAAQKSGSPDQKQLTQIMTGVMTVFMIGMFAVMYIIIPGLWTLFYGSRHVKATCEARDPVVRWTDRCPLPVLGISMLLLFSALMILAMPISFHGVFPFFGTFLSGASGTAAVLVVAMASVWAAWASYKLDLRGWWLIVVGVVLYALSTTLTYSQHTLDEVYRLMQMSQEQIDQIGKFQPLGQSAMRWGPLIFALPALGYMLYVKKYFRQAS